MVTQGADAPTVQAVLASHPNASGVGELGVATQGAGNIPQNITQMSTV